MLVMGRHNPLKGTGLKAGQQFDVVEGYAKLLAPCLGGYSFSPHDCSVLTGWVGDMVGEMN